jgi:hypothetical protein
VFELVNDLKVADIDGDETALDCAGGNTVDVTQNDIQLLQEFVDPLG